MAYHRDMKIAICIPSRGLIHSRTIEPILDLGLKTFLTHNLPIPDCFNDLTRRAIDWGADVLWFIEEDNGIKPDTYEKMATLIKEYSVVVHNYQAEGDTIRTVNNRLLFGTGCTMIRREVLIDYVWDSNYHYILPDFKRLRIKNSYGGHDIEFAMYCYRNKIPVKAIMDNIAHYKVQTLGEDNKNKGFHIVKDLSA